MTVDPQVVEATGDLSSEYHSLLAELKSAFDKETNRVRRVSLLTLAPKCWSRAQIATYFGTSEKMVRQARVLREKKGRPVAAVA